MTDETNLPNPPESTPGGSGSRWEPDPAAPAGGVAPAPVPPADPPYAGGQPAAAAPGPRRPTRTQLLTGGLAAASLVIVGGLGFAVGHAAGGDEHERDGFSDVSFQPGQGDHGLPPGTDGGRVPPPPAYGDDDGDDGGLFGLGDDDHDEADS